MEARALFAAEKVSKARELRLRLSCGLGEERAAQKLRHYRASLSMLERWLRHRNPILEQLRFELETVDTLPLTYKT